MLDFAIVPAAGKKREREEKLKLEISAAKRERDFYMSKVEQSRALKFMRERKEKVCNPQLSIVFNNLTCKVVITCFSFQY